MKLQLISLDHAFIEAADDLFKDRATVACCDIAYIPRDGVAFVSPANSLGFMDGGIDMVLNHQMFVGCEKQLKKMIADLGHKTALGRPYLRVGSALWFMVGPKTGFIAAPTMFLPHDVADTQNAYWAFIAALVAMDRIEKATGGAIHTLVCTSLCCGVGRMDPEQAAIQMRRAWDDFHAGRIPEETEWVGPEYVLLPHRDDQQPSNYDNREIGVEFPKGFRI
jgi:O-acetyl-ADP-ribose deacetylase (regulator of RNase III)